MRISRCRIGDQSTGQRLHGNKAHIRFLTGLYQRFLLFRSQITKGELQCLIQAAFNGLLCHMQTMVRNTDMPDLSLFFASRAAS